MDLKTLKCLDLSKNKFHSETQDHLLSKLPVLSNLRTLSISQVDLGDECLPALLEMIKNIHHLKKLNISGNYNLQSSSIREMLFVLKDLKLQEIDLSKLNMDG